MDVRTLLIAGLLAAAPAAAQEVQVAPVGRHTLPNTAQEQLTAITVRYAPGAKSEPHRHGASAFVYVLDGTVRSHVEGETPRDFGPGESWFETAGAHHLVSENASRSAPATILVVFVGARGATLSIVDN